jgi:hypothetical protein
MREFRKLKRGFNRQKVDARHGAAIEIAIAVGGVVDAGPVAGTEAATTVVVAEADGRVVDSFW